MTSSRARRYGTLLSVVLALLLATALAACTDDGGDPGEEGTPGSLLERAAEEEATREAGDDDGADPGDEGTLGSLLERAAEPEAAQEAVAAEPARERPRRQRTGRRWLPSTTQRTAQTGRGMKTG